MRTVVRFSLNAWGLVRVSARRAAYLRIPPILPSNQPDQRSQHIFILPLALQHLEYALQRLWGEANPQTCLVGLDRFGRMMQPFGQFAENLPFLGRFLVVE